MNELMAKNHKIEVFTETDHLVGFSDNPILEVNKEYAILRGGDSVGFYKILIEDICFYKITAVFSEGDK